MLVISRREGEAFQIGPDILVTVVRIKGQVIRIGIDAPRELKVLRDDHEEFHEGRARDSSSTSLP